MARKKVTRSSMETCFKILQFKYGQKLSNRCIGLTLKISPSTVYEVLSRFKIDWPPESPDSWYHLS